MKIIHDMIDKLIIAYVIVSYVMMWQVYLFELDNRDVIKEKDLNTLQVLVSAAPVTIAYILIKNELDGEVK